MQNDKGVAYRLKIARGRGRLMLGSALGGVMMTALVPGAAAAMVVTSSPYRISAPVLTNTAGPVASGPILSFAPRHVAEQDAALFAIDPAPQDLTARPVARLVTPVKAAAATDVTINQGDITTTGDNMPGIASTTDGSTTITAGNITTSGAYSPGVSVTGGGPIAITTGNITTSGNFSDGIDATGGGSVTIKTGDVTTTGDYSRGISATANGDISIDAGTVYSSGQQATGIYAKSATGNVSINAGSVTSLSPHSAIGIYAYGHNVNVTVGSVTAYEHARLRTVGISAVGVGADADVQVTLNGDLVSHGARAAGIVVSSDGTAEVVNNGSITVDEYPGDKSDSAAIQVYAQKNVSITNNGSVYSGVAGISAASLYGNIIISSTGSVAAYQTGISASTVHTVVEPGGYYQNGKYYPNSKLVVGGSVTIEAGNVTGGGIDGNAIFAAGSSVDITLNGTVSNVHGAGVYARGYAGGVSIHNNGSIVSGYHGIDAAAYGDVIIDGSGTVSAPTIAIAAKSIGGSVSIKQGDIVGSIDAEAVATGNGGLGDPTKSVDVSVGNVTSNAPKYSAIVAINGNYYSQVSVKAGDIKAYGDSAAGIVAIAPNGTANITANSITTKGLYATGLLVAETSNVSINVGSVTTINNDANGIEIEDFAGQPKGTIAITVGDLTTVGNSSLGIALAADADTTISAGTISTAGTRSLGIYASALGSDDHLTIGANSITTSGDNSSAILALGVGGPIDITAGTITTSGIGSAGIVALSYNGSVSAKATSISTTGGGAPAVAIYSFGGSANVDVGSATTTGIKAPALLAIGETDATVTAGTVSTSGDNSNGIVIRSGAYGVGGTGVVTVNSVTTAGDVTAAIDALASGDADHASSMTITANTITTTGQDAVGINALADYGPLSIKVGSINTKGAESNGILAFGGGTIGLQVGSITSAATAIYAIESGSGAVTLGVTGKIASSAGDGFDAVNQAGTTSIQIASTGGVQGAGDAIAVQSGSGAVSVTNAGTITGGAGYAIDVSGLQERTAGSSIVTIVGTPATSIVNSGTIVGAVQLSGGDDTLTNSGIFVATKDSNFGAGNDLFVNDATLTFASSSKATAISLLGLEKFQNAGIIDLRNGVAGDTLTLPGSYVGSGNAKLGLDVGGNGVADKLVVAGIASGTTSIVLDATAANATLIAKPITLVQVGAGTASTAFTIANQDLGFVTYGLAFNAASNSFQLSSTAGAAVHRLTKINQGAQAIWQQSADAWPSHMAELRDDGQPAKRVWGQAYGQTDSSSDHGQGYALGYRQDYYGGQAGFDLGGKRTEDGDGLLFGVTGGYLSSHLNLHAGPERVRYDTLNAGGYASLRKGVFFVNLLGQYDHYRTTADNSVEHWTDKFSGHAYGAEAEAGARLGSDAFFAEPIASIAWQRTDIGTLQALGQSLDFGHDTGLTGTIGGRFGATFDMQGGDKAVLYAKASYVHEFKGKGGLLFESGGTSEDVAGSRIGDYGKAAIGVNVLTTGRVSGFIEGDADAGSLKGGGGRVGLSYKL